MTGLEKEFFQFIYDRQLIWYKRFVLKEKQPWTKDIVLQKYKIINMYRELDKCTSYILQKLNGIENREQLLINIIFYRFFNQFNLYEKLELNPFKKIDNETKLNLLKGLEKIKAQNQPIFNNAYLISSGKKGERKHVSIINNLQKLNTKKMIEYLDKSKTPRESLEVLQQIPMVGPFLACEIWTDLTYLRFFKQEWTDNDFVNIGPGAKWGLEVMYNQKLTKKEQGNKLENLHKIQKSFLDSKWKNIAYKNAFSNYPFLSITNMEGALCEFRKYWRIKHGKGRRKYFHLLTPKKPLESDKTT